MTKIIVVRPLHKVPGILKVVQNINWPFSIFCLQVSMKDTTGIINIKVKVVTINHVLKVVHIYLCMNAYVLVSEQDNQN